MAISKDNNDKITINLNDLHKERGKAKKINTDYHPDIGHFSDNEEILKTVKQASDKAAQKLAGDKLGKEIGGSTPLNDFMKDYNAMPHTNKAIVDTALDYIQTLSDIIGEQRIISRMIELKGWSTIAGPNLPCVNNIIQLIWKVSRHGGYSNSTAGFPTSVASEINVPTGQQIVSLYANKRIDGDLPPTDALFCRGYKYVRKSGYNAAEIQQKWLNGNTSYFIDIAINNRAEIELELATFELNFYHNNIISRINTITNKIGAYDKTTNPQSTYYVLDKGNNNNRLCLIQCLKFLSRANKKPNSSMKRRLGYTDSTIKGDGSFTENAPTLSSLKKYVMVVQAGMEVVLKNSLLGVFNPEAYTGLEIPQIIGLTYTPVGFEATGTNTDSQWTIYGSDDPINDDTDGAIDDKTLYVIEDDAFHRCYGYDATTTDRAIDSPTILVRNYAYGFVFASVQAQFFRFEFPEAMDAPTMLKWSVNG